MTWKLDNTINCPCWKVAVEDKNFFFNYDKDVTLMATKSPAENICAHLGTNPKI